MDFDPNHQLISKVVFAYQYISCAGLLPALVPELPDHGMAALSGSTHLPSSSLSSHIGNGSRRFDQLNWPAPGSENTKLGVLMELEVGHGETEVYPGVQA
jgi:hypothetical protein